MCSLMSALPKVLQGFCGWLHWDPKDVSTGMLGHETS